MATSKGQASNISQSEATSPGKLDGEQQIGGNRHIRALSGSTRNSALFIGILIAVAVIGSAVFILSSLGFRAFLAYPVLGSLGILGRHITLVRGRSESANRAWLMARSGVHPDTSRLSALYLTYVLGSGGHTGELCEVIKQTFRATGTLHRRYIVTSGDTQSLTALARVEDLIHCAYPAQSAGTWDVHEVVRARKVHQPFWTAPYTSLLSALSVVAALVEPPGARAGSSAQVAFRYPQLIITNGPGTGFIVCLVAHLLKMCWLVPKDRLKIVYIETWAHMSTLSLTGRLFYYTDIADTFIVQHKKLADKTGKRFVGEVAKSGNFLGI